MAWILDLDGVVWLGARPIGGSADAVRRLIEAGEKVVLVTNSSLFTVAEQVERLGAMGLPAGFTLLTSAMAAATLVAPAETALVCGGPGVAEALESRGAKVVREGDADAVVVGFHTDFDYGRLRAAHAAVVRGARLVATNDDPTYPTPAGPIPGGGAIVAAVATASGVTPVVAGKPHAPMVALCRQAAGPGPHVVVGDRDSTDGALARALGARFVLVLSGVTSEIEPAPAPAPDLVAEDLKDAVTTLLG